MTALIAVVAAVVVATLAGWLLTHRAGRVRETQPTRGGGPDTEGLGLSRTGPTVVHFSAPWCGPCKGFAPVYEKAAETHPDVVFAKVNTDEQQELAGSFGIRSIPTLIVFREKVILFQQAGALPGAALEQVITQAKALDMSKVHAEVAAQQGNQTAK